MAGVRNGPRESARGPGSRRPRRRPRAWAIRRFRGGGTRGECLDLPALACDAVPRTCSRSPLRRPPTIWTRSCRVSGCCSWLIVTAPGCSPGRFSVQDGGGPAWTRTNDQRITSPGRGASGKGIRVPGRVLGCGRVRSSRPELLSDSLSPDVPPPSFPRIIAGASRPANWAKFSAGTVEHGASSERRGEVDFVVPDALTGGGHPRV